MNPPLTTPLPPRPLRGLLVAASVLTVGFAALLSRVPFEQFQLVMSSVLIPANLWMLWAFMDRMKGWPSERRGWLLLSLSIPMVLGANGVLALAGPLQEEPRALDWMYAALTLSAGLLQSWALLAWPWRGKGEQPLLIDLLGSLLFGSSLALLFWLLGIWQDGFQGHAVIHARTVAMAGRLAITGGVVVFLLSEDPRRIRGPLGWFFVSLLLFGFFVGVLLRPLTLPGATLTTIGPGFAVAPLIPFFLGLSAWHRRPVEVAPEQPPLKYHFAECVPYVPFLLAGGVLGVAVLQQRGPLTWPLLTFLVITGVMVWRQFLLFRELKVWNQELEARVLARTRSLESLQSLMLKTERMNAMATLGAGLAHDLNNLLSVIRNSAELMQMDLAEGQKPSDRDLGRIVEAAGQAGTLTHRVMAFGRKESEVEGPGVMDLCEAVASSQELVRMLLPRNIDLRLEGQVEPCPVRLDSAVLEQVLVNLVGNARDAMPEGGRVTLRLRDEVAPGGHHLAVMEVGDTGPGIPREIQEAIFEAFFTTKPTGKGTGLGLASVRALVEAQGGTVGVESLPGQGATFRLTFPMVP